MSLRSAALAVFITLGFAPALANPLEEELAAMTSSCWERTYDAAHLEAHPRQLVTAIRLSADRLDDGTVAAWLGINLRKHAGGQKFDYAASAHCKAFGSALICKSEWDAGSFTLEKAKGGMLVRNREMVVNPSNYDSEDIADNAVDLGESDDAVWLLSRRSAEGCELY